MAAKINQMNLPKQPRQPVIPSPKKLPIKPNNWTPQPNRPRITNKNNPIRIIRNIAPMFFKLKVCNNYYAWYSLNCLRHKKGANHYIPCLKVLDYPYTKEWIVRTNTYIYNRYPSHTSRMDTIIHIGANNLMLHSCILRIVQILRPNCALLLSLLCLSIRLTMQILLFLLDFSNIRAVFTIP